VQKFAVFGNPIAHSKSPELHNALFEKYHIDAIYEKVKVENAKEIKEYIIKNNIVGANITVPFKEDIMSLCDELSKDAKNIQSVNTITFKDGILKGYNTDGHGFMESISHYKNIKNTLIIGAGGSARSVALSLFAKNIDLLVTNRSKKRLEFYKNKNIKTTLTQNIEIKKYDLIINTTSAGLEDDSLPMEIDTLKSLISQADYIVDIIYGKKTPFLELAKSMKKTYQDGAMMLVMQGVYASMIFADIGIKFEDRKNIMIEEAKKHILLKGSNKP
jgi:shikimate dehydrogenase